MLITLQSEIGRRAFFPSFPKRDLGGRKGGSRFYRAVEIANVAKVVNQHPKTTSSLILHLHIYASNPSGVNNSVEMKEIT